MSAELSRDARVAGRFVVRELAGRGASGAVYRAHDLETNADVALKIIVTETPDDHFMREAVVLEKLRHPGIVSFVAHGTMDDGNMYLALEWLDGQTLWQRLRAAPLGLVDALVLTRDLAVALAYAHAHDVIHRDIKPTNIFLTQSGVKLIDFGIAQLRRGTRITRTGMMMGTPAYMAPEQARAGPIDGRADIFSLGCVLYRCLAGAVPFGGDNITAILAKVLFEDPKPLRTHRRDVPVEIESLVMRMLAKDPSERVPSAKALIEELERAPTTELRASTAPASDASGPVVTMTERNFVSVVLARPHQGDGVAAETLDDVTLVEERDGAPRSDRAPATPRTQIVRLVDGTLAATFAGSAFPDHVEQAAHCALMMQRVLPEGRIVVTSGLAVVEQRLPMGEVIERAAHMIDREPGKLGGIRVDEISARLLDARFEIVRDGDESILLGERRTRARPRTLLGKPTPHVGRERELAALLGLLDECVGESTPRCAIVTGAAGLGKSRLVSEVIEQARKRWPSLVTWFARGDGMSAGSSFALAADLLRDATHARLGADARERLASTLALLAPDRREQDDELARDPRSFGDRVFEACEDLVRAVATPDTPLLIVLDDLQWGDLATVRLVNAAMRNLQNTPFCILAAARPDVTTRFPDLWTERAPLALSVSALSARAARKLVTTALGDVDESLVGHLVERAAGNAFHLEELVRAVAEGRGNSLPETVLAMISARMQTLDAESRRLLRAASVFGETFWEQGVLALVGDAADWTACAERLADLVKRELVVEATPSQFQGDVEYHFRHALVRDAAYAALTDADRVAGHRSAGEWLVAAGSNDMRALAEHFERGGVSEVAGTFHLRAAQQSLHGGDVAAVLESCARARACDATHNGAELARLEAEAHFWQGDFAHAEAAATACLAAVSVDDPFWWSCAAVAVVACLRREGWDRAEPIYERMHRAPHDAHVAATRLVASARVAVHLCAAGRFAEADTLIASIRAEVAREPQGDLVLGATRTAEGMRALCAGDIASYHDAVSEAVALFERGGDLRNTCNAECNLGFCRAELGAWAEAESALRASIARARRLGLVAIEYNALHNLGYALFRLGRMAEARAIELDCAAVFEAKTDGRSAGGSRLYLALIALELGELDEAKTQIDRALSLLAETPPVRAYALAVLALILLARGQTTEARNASIEASRLQSELGAMEQGESYVRLAAIETLRATGDLTGAHAAATVARDRLLERGAIMSGALRDSFFSRVPENARTFTLAAELSVA